MSTPATPPTFDALIAAHLDHCITHAARELAIREHEVTHLRTMLADAERAVATRQAEHDAFVAYRARLETLSL